VLVPGFTVTFENPFGLSPRMAPEPVRQKKTSWLSATLGMEMLPRLTLPSAMDEVQFDTVDEKALPMPLKLPARTTVAVSLFDRSFADPLGLKMFTVSVAASLICFDMAIALRTMVRVSGEPENSVALEGGSMSMNCIAPTKTAVAPKSLANALNERGRSVGPNGLHGYR